MRSDRRRLEDVLEAAANLRRHLPDDYARFADNELIQTWVVHHLQVIGEAAARLSPEGRARIPSLPWPDIVGLRNVIVHHYFGIDLLEVWNTAQRDVPFLETAIREALAAWPAD